MNAHKLSVFAVAAAGLLAAGSVFAQARTYNFTDRNVAGAPSGGCNSSLTATTSFATSFGNSVLCQQAGNSSTTAGSQNLTVSAWSSDGSGTTYRTAGVNDQGGSGFGIANQTEGLAAIPPGHSGDNVTPGIDMWQLTFSAAEALKTITLGWAGIDGDFQVLRWTGAGAAAAIGGRTAAQLLTDGWALMSSGVGTDTVFNGNNTEPQTFNFNSGNLTSTSWLISAYNSSWAGTGWTAGADEIKLQSIGTLRPSTVSTPGTLALAGLGLLGAAFLRRRNA